MDLPSLTVIVFAILSIVVYRVIVILCRILKFASPLAPPLPKPELDRDSYKWYLGFVNMFMELLKRIFYFDDLRNWFNAVSSSMIKLKLVAFVILLLFLFYSMVVGFLGKLQPLAAQIAIFKENVINQFLFQTIGSFNKVVSSIFFIRAFWLLVTELFGFGVFKWYAWKIDKCNKVIHDYQQVQAQKQQGGFMGIDGYASMLDVAMAMGDSIDALSRKAVRGTKEGSKMGYNAIKEDVSALGQAIKEIPKEIQKIISDYENLDQSSFAYEFLQRNSLLNTRVQKEKLHELLYAHRKAESQESDSISKSVLMDLMRVINSLTGQKDFIEFICYVLLACMLIPAAFDTNFLLSLVGNIKSTAIGMSAMQSAGTLVFLILVVFVLVILAIEVTFKKMNFTKEKLVGDKEHMEFKYLQRYLVNPSIIGKAIAESDLNNAYIVTIKDTMGAIGVPSLSAFIITIILCFTFYWVYWARTDKRDPQREANLVDASQLIKGSNMVFYVIAAIGFCLLLNGKSKQTIVKNQNKIFYVMLGLFLLLIATGIISSILIKVKQYKLENKDD